MRKILFLCTGNYYRSRFAEEYFNHLARGKGLKWKAFSKGLSQNIPNPDNPGPISKHAIEALEERKIKGRNLGRYPMPLDENDFHTYDYIIALSEHEHRPMIESRFHHHVDKIQFFEVGDLPVEEPKQAIKKLVRLIRELTNQLSQNKFR